jgi:NAD(P)-dependent dehydrogenase (short-subunit alcohol dehydrogenase family)
MTTVFAFFDGVEPDEFRRPTDVTYLGSVWGMRAALRRMGPRDRGTIVQSAPPWPIGIPLQAPYCGAKHGVQGVFESLRTELRHRGSSVHLTTVHLPGVNMPQFEHCRDKFDRRSQPVPPVYQPDAAAQAIHWAAHHRRREV